MSVVHFYIPDQFVNGAHFRYVDCESNEEILDKLDNLINLLAESVKLFNKSYYIDDEAYNNIKSFIDFKCLLL